jgi:hypothetical protein
LVSASKDCAESEEVQGKWMGGLRIIIWLNVVILLLTCITAVFTNLIFFGDFVHFPAKWLRSQKKTRKQDLSHFGKSHPHVCRFVPENLNLILSGNLSR